MRLSFLSEALIQVLNFISQELLVLWLRGCFGAVMGPLGAEHGCVLGQIRSEASTRRLSLLSEALIQNLKLLS